METLALQYAIERAEEKHDIVKKEEALKDAILEYETLCTSLGIQSKLDYPTEREKQEVDLTLQSKTVLLTNALLLSKGVLSPCIMDLNAEIANLYVKQTHLAKRLSAERMIHTAADELIHANYIQSDLNTLTDHEHKLQKAEEYGKLHSSEFNHLYIIVIFLYMFNAWMWIRW